VTGEGVEPVVGLIASGEGSARCFNSLGFLAACCPYIPIVHYRGKKH